MPVAPAEHDGITGVTFGSGGRCDLRTVPAGVTAAVDHLSCGACPLVNAGRLAVVGHSLGGWAAPLAAAGDPRLRAVAACAAAVDIGALDLDPAGTEREF